MSSRKQFRSNHNIYTAKIKIILTSKAAYTVKKSVPLYTTHNTTTCYVIIFLNETFRGKKSAKTDTKVYESYLAVSLIQFLWRRKWQSIPVFLPGESHGHRKLAAYSWWDRNSWTRLSAIFLSFDSMTSLNF